MMSVRNPLLGPVTIFVPEKSNDFVNEVSFQDKRFSSSVLRSPPVSEMKSIDQ